MFAEKIYMISSGIWISFGPLGNYYMMYKYNIEVEA